MKRPVSMPCTEEQWLNEVKPLCDKYGLKYKHIGNFKVLELLANLVWGEKVITNLSKDDCNIKKFELIPYNPIEFIKACGVEVEQPKWEKRTRGGCKYYIYQEFDGKIWGRVYHIGLWDSCTWDINGISRCGINQYDLIPYNPRKTELLTKKAELEKQLEEINKELNQ